MEINQESVYSSYTESTYQTDAIVQKFRKASIVTCILQSANTLAHYSNKLPHQVVLTGTFVSLPPLNFFFSFARALIPY
jgi:hypothetical protein